MDIDDRRMSRVKRGSTRNETCGLGGNEPSKKPKLKKKEETTPVRKPRLSVPNPSAKGEKVPDPSKIRDVKPKAMSLNDPIKVLQEFNEVVNVLTDAGMSTVDQAGGFSAIAQAQQNLFNELKGVDKEFLSSELLNTFSRLEDAVKMTRYVHKELRPDGTWKYYY